MQCLLTNDIKVVAVLMVDWVRFSLELTREQAVNIDGCPRERKHADYVDRRFINSERRTKLDCKKLRSFKIKAADGI